MSFEDLEAVVNSVVMSALPNRTLVLNGAVRVRGIFERSPVGEFGLMQSSSVRVTVAAAAVGPVVRGDVLLLKEGDRVVLVSENRPEFCIADLAIMAAGCITVPTYTTNTERDHQHILDNSGAKAVIVSTAKLARTLGQQMEASPCAGLYAITADMDFEVHYGKRANKRRKMYNGMIPCQLYMYYSAPKFEHTAKPMPKSGFDGKRTAPNRFNKK